MQPRQGDVAHGADEGKDTQKEERGSGAGTPGGGR